MSCRLLLITICFIVSKFSTVPSKDGISLDKKCVFQQSINSRCVETHNYVSSLYNALDEIVVKYFNGDELIENDSEFVKNGIVQNSQRNEDLNLKFEKISTHLLMLKCLKKIIWFVFVLFTSMFLFGQQIKILKKETQVSIFMTMIGLTLVQMSIGSDLFKKDSKFDTNCLRMMIEVESKVLCNMEDFVSSGHLIEYMSGLVIVGMIIGSFVRSLCEPLFEKRHRIHPVMFLTLMLLFIHSINSLPLDSNLENDLGISEEDSFYEQVFNKKVSCDDINSGGCNQTVLVVGSVKARIEKKPKFLMDIQSFGALPGRTVGFDNEVLVNCDDQRLKNKFSKFKGFEVWTQGCYGEVPGFHWVAYPENAPYGVKLNLYDNNFKNRLNVGTALCPLGYVYGESRCIGEPVYIDAREVERYSFDLQVTTRLPKTFWFRIENRDVGIFGYAYIEGGGVIFCASMIGGDLMLDYTRDKKFCSQYFSLCTFPSEKSGLTCQIYPIAVENYQMTINFNKEIYRGQVIRWYDIVYPAKWSLEYIYITLTVNQNLIRGSTTYSTWKEGGHHCAALMNYEGDMYCKFSPHSRKVEFRGTFYQVEGNVLLVDKVTRDFKCRIYCLSEEVQSMSFKDDFGNHFILIKPAFWRENEPDWNLPLQVKVLNEVKDGSTQTEVEEKPKKPDVNDGQTQTEIEEKTKKPDINDGQTQTEIEDKTKKPDINDGSTQTDNEEKPKKPETNDGGTQTEVDITTIKPTITKRFVDGSTNTDPIEVDKKEVFNEYHHKTGEGPRFIDKSCIDNGKCDDIVLTHVPHTVSGVANIALYITAVVLTWISPIMSVPFWIASVGFHVAIGQVCSPVHVPLSLSTTNGNYDGHVRWWPGQCLHMKVRDHDYTFRLKKITSPLGSRLDRAYLLNMTLEIWVRYHCSYYYETEGDCHDVTDRFCYSERINSYHCGAACAPHWCLLIGTLDTTCRATAKKEITPNDYGYLWKIHHGTDFHYAIDFNGTTYEGSGDIFIGNEEWNITFSFFSPTFEKDLYILYYNKESYLFYTPPGISEVPSHSTPVAGTNWVSKDQVGVHFKKCIDGEGDVVYNINFFNQLKVESLGKIHEHRIGHGIEFAVRGSDGWGKTPEGIVHGEYVESRVVAFNMLYISRCANGNCTLVSNRFLTRDYGTLYEYRVVCEKCMPPIGSKGSIYVIGKEVESPTSMLVYVRCSTCWKTGTLIFGEQEFQLNITDVDLKYLWNITQMQVHQTASQLKGAFGWQWLSKIVEFAKIISSKMLGIFSFLTQNWFILFLGVFIVACSTVMFDTAGGVIASFVIMIALIAGVSGQNVEVESLTDNDQLISIFSGLLILLLFCKVKFFLIVILFLFLLKIIHDHQQLVYELVIKLVTLLKPRFSILKHYATILQFLSFLAVCLALRYPGGEFVLMSYLVRKTIMYFRGYQHCRSLFAFDLKFNCIFLIMSLIFSSLVLPLPILISCLVMLGVLTFTEFKNRCFDGSEVLKIGCNSSDNFRVNFFKKIDFKLFNHFKIKKYEKLKDNVISIVSHRVDIARLMKECCSQYRNYRINFHDNKGVVKSHVNFVVGKNNLAFAGHDYLIMRKFVPENLLTIEHQFSEDIVVFGTRPKKFVSNLYRRKSFVDKTCFWNYSPLLRSYYSVEGKNQDKIEKEYVGKSGSVYGNMFISVLKLQVVDHNKYCFFSIPRYLQTVNHVFKSKIKYFSDQKLESNIEPELLRSDFRKIKKKAVFKKTNVSIKQVKNKTSHITKMLGSIKKQLVVEGERKFIPNHFKQNVRDLSNIKDEYLPLFGKSKRKCKQTCKNKQRFRIDWDHQIKLKNVKQFSVSWFGIKAKRITKKEKDLTVSMEEYKNFYDMLDRDEYLLACHDGDCGSKCCSKFIDQLPNVGHIYVNGIKMLYCAHACTKKMWKKLSVENSKFLWLPRSDEQKSKVKSKNKFSILGKNNCERFIDFKKKLMGGHKVDFDRFNPTIMFDKFTKAQLTKLKEVQKDNDVIVKNVDLNLKAREFSETYKKNLSKFNKGSRERLNEIELLTREMPADVKNTIKIRENLGVKDFVKKQNFNLHKRSNSVDSKFNKKFVTDINGIRHIANLDEVFDNGFKIVINKKNSKLNEKFKKNIPKFDLSDKPIVIKTVNVNDVDVEDKKYVPMSERLKMNKQVIKRDFITENKSLSTGAINKRFDIDLLAKNFFSKGQFNHEPVVVSRGVFNNIKEKYGNEKNFRNFSKRVGYYPDGKKIDLKEKYSLYLQYGGDMLKKDLISNPGFNKIYSKKISGSLEALDRNQKLLNSLKPLSKSRDNFIACRGLKGPYYPPSKFMSRPQRLKYFETHWDEVPMESFEKKKYLNECAIASNKTEIFKKKKKQINQRNVLYDPDFIKLENLKKQGAEIVIDPAGDLIVAKDGVAKVIGDNFKVKSKSEVHQPQLHVKKKTFSELPKIGLKADTYAQNIMTVVEDWIKGKEDFAPLTVSNDQFHDVKLKYSKTPEYDEICRRLGRYNSGIQFSKPILGLNYVMNGGNLLIKDINSLSEKQLNDINEVADTEDQKERAAILRKMLAEKKEMKDLKIHSEFKPCISQFSYFDYDSMAKTRVNPMFNILSEEEKLTHVKKLRSGRSGYIHLDDKNYIMLNNAGLLESKVLRKNVLGRIGMKPGFQELGNPWRDFLQSDQPVVVHTIEPSQYHLWLDHYNVIGDIFFPKQFDFVDTGENFNRIVNSLNLFIKKKNQVKIHCQYVDIGNFLNATCIKVNCVENFVVGDSGSILSIEDDNFSQIGSLIGRDLIDGTYIIQLWTKDIVGKFLEEISEEIDGLNEEYNLKIDLTYRDVNYLRKSLIKKNFNVDKMNLRHVIRTSQIDLMEESQLLKGNITMPSSKYLKIKSRATLDFQNEKFRLKFSALSFDRCFIFESGLFKDCDHLLVCCETKINDNCDLIKFQIKNSLFNWSTLGILIGEVWTPLNLLFLIQLYSKNFKNNLELMTPIIYKGGQKNIKYYPFMKLSKAPIGFCSKSVETPKNVTRVFYEIDSNVSIVPPNVILWFDDLDIDTNLFVSEKDFNCVKSVYESHFKYLSFLYLSGRTEDGKLKDSVSRLQIYVKFESGFMLNEIKNWTEGLVSVSLSKIECNDDKEKGRFKKVLHYWEFNNFGHNLEHEYLTQSIRDKKERVSVEMERYWFNNMQHIPSSVHKLNVGLLNSWLYIRYQMFPNDKSRINEFCRIWNKLHVQGSKLILMEKIQRKEIEEVVEFDNEPKVVHTLFECHKIQYKEKNWMQIGDILFPPNFNFPEVTNFELMENFLDIEGMYVTISKAFDINSSPFIFVNCDYCFRAGDSGKFFKCNGVKCGFFVGTTKFDKPYEYVVQVWKKFSNLEFNEIDEVDPVPVCRTPYVSHKLSQTERRNLSQKRFTLCGDLWFEPSFRNDHDFTQLDLHEIYIKNVKIDVLINLKDKYPFGYFKTNLDLKKGDSGTFIYFKNEPKPIGVLIGKMSNTFKELFVVQFFFLDNRIAGQINFRQFIEGDFCRFDNCKHGLFGFEFFSDDERDKEIEKFESYLVSLNMNKCHTELPILQDIFHSFDTEFQIIDEQELFSNGLMEYHIGQYVKYEILHNEFFFTVLKKLNSEIFNLDLDFEKIDENLLLSLRLERYVGSLDEELSLIELDFVKEVLDLELVDCDDEELTLSPLVFCSRDTLNIFGQTKKILRIMRESVDGGYIGLTLRIGEVIAFKFRWNYSAGIMCCYNLKDDFFMVNCKKIDEIYPMEILNIRYVLGIEINHHPIFEFNKIVKPTLLDREEFRKDLEISKVVDKHVFIDEGKNDVKFFDSEEDISIKSVESLNKNKFNDMMDPKELILENQYLLNTAESCQFQYFVCVKFIEHLPEGHIENGLIVSPNLIDNRSYVLGCECEGNETNYDILSSIVESMKHIYFHLQCNRCERVLDLNLVLNEIIQPNTQHCTVYFSVSHQGEKFIRDCYNEIVKKYKSSYFSWYKSESFTSGLKGHFNYRDGDLQEINCNLSRFQSLMGIFQGEEMNSLTPGVIFNFSKPFGAGRGYVSDGHSIITSAHVTNGAPLMVPHLVGDTIQGYFKMNCRIYDPKNDVAIYGSTPTFSDVSIGEFVYIPDPKTRCALLFYVLGIQPIRLLYVHKEEVNKSLGFDEDGIEIFGPREIVYRLGDILGIPGLSGSPILNLNNELVGVYSTTSQLRIKGNISFSEGEKVRGLTGFTTMISRPDDGKVTVDSMKKDLDSKFIHDINCLIEIHQPTGMGKSTRIPAWIFENYSNIGLKVNILLLVPRTSQVESLLKSYENPKIKNEFKSQFDVHGFYGVGSMQPILTLDKHNLIISTYGRVTSMKRDSWAGLCAKCNVIILDEYHTNDPAVMFMWHEAKLRVNNQECVSNFFGLAEKPIYVMSATPRKVWGDVGKCQLTGSPRHKITINEVDINEFRQTLAFKNQFETDINYYLRISGDQYYVFKKNWFCDDGCNLVFLPSRELCEKFSKLLLSEGKKSGFYHGKKKDIDFNEKLSNGFIVCATNALQEGVTIPNCKVVITLNNEGFEEVEMEGCQFVQRNSNFCSENCAIDFSKCFLVDGMITTSHMDYIQRVGRTGRTCEGVVYSIGNTVSSRVVSNQTLIQIECLSRVFGCLPVTKNIYEEFERLELSSELSRLYLTCKYPEPVILCAYRNIFPNIFWKWQIEDNVQHLVPKYDGSWADVKNYWQKTPFLNVRASHRLMWAKLFLTEEIWPAFKKNCEEVVSEGDSIAESCLKNLTKSAFNSLNINEIEGIENKIQNSWTIALLTMLSTTCITVSGLMFSESLIKKIPIQINKFWIVKDGNWQSVLSFQSGPYQSLRMYQESWAGGMLFWSYQKVINFKNFCYEQIVDLWSSKFSCNYTCKDLFNKLKEKYSPNDKEGESHFQTFKNIINKKIDWVRSLWKYFRSVSPKSNDLDLNNFKKNMDEFCEIEEETEVKNDLWDGLLNGFQQMFQGNINPMSIYYFVVALASLAGCTTLAYLSPIIGRGCSPLAVLILEMSFGIWMFSSMPIIPSAVVATFTFVSTIMFNLKSKYQTDNIGVASAVGLGSALVVGLTLRHFDLVSNILESTFEKLRNSKLGTKAIGDSIFQLLNYSPGGIFGSIGNGFGLATLIWDSLDQYSEGTGSLSSMGLNIFSLVVTGASGDYVTVLTALVAYFIVAGFQMGIDQNWIIQRLHTLSHMRNTNETAVNATFAIEEGSKNEIKAKARDKIRSIFLGLNLCTNPVKLIPVLIGFFKDKMMMNEQDFNNSWKVNAFYRACRPVIVALVIEIFSISKYLLTGHDPEEVQNSFDMTVFFSQIGDNIASGFGSLMSIFSSGFAAVKNFFLTDFSIFFTRVWNSLSEWIPKSWNWISTSISSLWDKIFALIAVIWVGLSKFFGFKLGEDLPFIIGNETRTAISDGMGNSKEIIFETINNSKDAISSILNNGKNVVTETIDKSKNVIQTTVGNGKKIVSDIKIYSEKSFPIVSSTSGFTKTLEIGNTMAVVGASLAGTAGLVFLGYKIYNWVNDKRENFMKKISFRHVGQTSYDKIGDVETTHYGVNFIKIDYKNKVISTGHYGQKNFCFNGEEVICDNHTLILFKLRGICYKSKSKVSDNFFLNELFLDENFNSEFSHFEMLIDWIYEQWNLTGAISGYLPAAAVSYFDTLNKYRCKGQAGMMKRPVVILCSNKNEMTEALKVKYEGLCVMETNKFKYLDPGVICVSSDISVKSSWKCYIPKELWRFKFLQNIVDKFSGEIKVQNFCVDKSVNEDVLISIGCQYCIPNPIGKLVVQRNIHDEKVELILENDVLQVKSFVDTKFDNLSQINLNKNTRKIMKDIKKRNPNIFKLFHVNSCIIMLSLRKRIHKLKSLTYIKYYKKDINERDMNVSLKIYDQLDEELIVNFLEGNDSIHCDEHRSECCNCLECCEFFDELFKNNQLDLDNYFKDLKFIRSVKSEYNRLESKLDNQLKFSCYRDLNPIKDGVFHNQNLLSVNRIEYLKEVIDELSEEVQKFNDSIEFNENEILDVEDQLGGNIVKCVDYDCCICQTCQLKPNFDVDLRKRKLREEILKIKDEIEEFKETIQLNEARKEFLTIHLCGFLRDRSMIGCIESGQPNCCLCNKCLILETFKDDDKIKRLGLIYQQVEDDFKKCIISELNDDYCLCKDCWTRSYPANLDKLKEIQEFVSLIIKTKRIYCPKSLIHKSILSKIQRFLDVDFGFNCFAKECEGKNFEIDDKFELSFKDKKNEIYQEENFEEEEIIEKETKEEINQNGKSKSLNALSYEKVLNELKNRFKFGRFFGSGEIKNGKDVDCNVVFNQNFLIDGEKIENAVGKKNKKDCEKIQKKQKKQKKEVDHEIDSNHVDNFVNNCFGKGCFKNGKSENENCNSKMIDGVFDVSKQLRNLEIKCKSRQSTINKWINKLKKNNGKDEVFNVKLEDPIDERDFVEVPIENDEFNPFGLEKEDNFFSKNYDDYEFKDQKNNKFDEVEPQQVGIFRQIIERIRIKAGFHDNQKISINDLDGEIVDQCQREDVNKIEVEVQVNNRNDLLFTDETEIKNSFGIKELISFFERTFLNKVDLVPFNRGKPYNPCSKKKLIWIFGQTCCGKSFYSHYLEKRGFKVFFMDTKSSLIPRKEHLDDFDVIETNGRIRPEWLPRNNIKVLLFDEDVNIRMRIKQRTGNLDYRSHLSEKAKKWMDHPELFDIVCHSSTNNFDEILKLRERSAISKYRRDRIKQFTLSPEKMADKLATTMTLQFDRYQIKQNLINENFNNLNDEINKFEILCPNVQNFFVSRQKMINFNTKVSQVKKVYNNYHNTEFIEEMSWITDHSDEYVKFRSACKYERIKCIDEVNQPSRGFRKFHFLNDFLKLERLKRRVRVLELGAGSGGFTTYLGGILTDGHVVCVNQKSERIDINTVNEVILRNKTGCSIQMIIGNLQEKIVQDEILNCEKFDCLILDVACRDGTIFHRSRFLFDQNFYNPLVQFYIPNCLKEGGCLILKQKFLLGVKNDFSKLISEFEFCAALRDPEGYTAAGEFYFVLENYSPSKSIQRIEGAKNFCENVELAFKLVSKFAINCITNKKKSLGKLGSINIKFKQGKFINEPPLVLEMLNKNVLGYHVENPDVPVNVDGYWPLGSEILLKDVTFKHRLKKIQIRSWLGRTHDQVKSFLKMHYKHVRPCQSSVFEFLPSLWSWKVNKKIGEDKPRTVALWKEVFGRVFGMNYLNQAHAYSIPTVGRTLEGLSRADFPHSDISARIVNKGIEAALSIFDQNVPKARPLTWLEIIEKCNPKGALGTLEAGYGTLGDLVIDKNFQRMVEELEELLFQGEMLVCHYNIQGKLELKLRDMVTGDDGEFTPEMIKSLKEMRLIHGPGYLKQKLEEDVFIKARVISFLDAKFRVIELKYIGAIEHNWVDHCNKPIGMVYNKTPWEVQKDRVEFHDLLKSKGVQVGEYAGDLSKMDGRMGYSNHLIKKFVYLSACSSDRMEKIVDNLIDHVIGAGRLVDSLGLYFGAYNHGAGSQWTSKGHSILLASMILVTMSEAMGLSFDELVKRHHNNEWRMYCMGDDHLIIGPKQMCDRFNLEAPRIFEEFGHVIRFGKEFHGVVKSDKSLTFLGYSPDPVYILGKRYYFTKRSVCNDLSRFLATKDFRLCEDSDISRMIMASKAIAIMILQPTSWILNVFARLTLSYCGMPTQFTANDLKKIGNVGTLLLTDVTPKIFDRIPEKLWGVKWKDIPQNRGEEEMVALKNFFEFANVYPSNKYKKRIYEMTDCKKTLIKKIVRTMVSVNGYPPFPDFLKDNNFLENECKHQGLIREFNFREFIFGQHNKNR